MANLKKLRLEVDEKYCTRPILHIATLPEHAKYEGVMARFLTQAQNLEYLFLDMPCMDTNGLSDQTLRTCRLPMLRLILLRGTCMLRDELITFVRGSPALEHLVIENCRLGNYLWKDLIALIKTLLKSLHMTPLFGGFADLYSSPTVYFYEDSRGDVEKYLLHDGPNPFSDEALSRCLDRPRENEFWNPPVTCKAMEYYERYF